MIRRTVWYGARDQRVVKWALVAAAFALSMGYFAEHRLAARNSAEATSVAEQAVEVQAADAARGTS
jgi:hypothetical protein